MSMDNWLSEKKVPCDRPGDDEDMAQAVLMLARNRYVNGQTVVVDGGLLFGMVSLGSEAECFCCPLLYFSF